MAGACLAISPPTTPPLGPFPRVLAPRCICATPAPELTSCLPPFPAASSPHSEDAALALADGDAVVLRGADDDGVPWVGTVSSHDPGKGTVAISWFYRKPDVAAPLLRKLEERHHCQLQANEVFATTHSDVNPIESVVRMCTVSSDPEDKKVRREPRAPPPRSARAPHILSRGGPPLLAPAPAPTPAATS